jgi:uncharacterized protein
MASEERAVRQADISRQDETLGAEMNQLPSDLSLERRVMTSPPAGVPLPLILAVAALAWVSLYALNERLWTPLLGAIGVDVESRWGGAIHFFAYDSVKIMLLLVGLIFAIGLLRASLSAERARSMLMGKGFFVGLLLAAALGAVTPFCSCSSVPLFIGLVAAGVPLGVTMTFLITSPLINQVGVVMLAGMFGWQIAALYVITGMTMAVVAGLALSRLNLDRWVEPFVFTLSAGQPSADGADPTLRERVDAARVDTIDIVKRVWPYVLVGIGLGAVIHGWVPADFFADYAGSNNPLAVPVAIVVGIPLYANVASVVPLAEALWAKGVGLGTLMAFMMSVVALSLPSLVLLRRVLMLPLLIIFTAIISSGILLIGLLFNLIA